jgi:hypothetical protein
MLPVSNPGSAASLTFHVSPFVFVTVVHAHAGDEAASSAAHAAADASEILRK